MKVICVPFERMIGDESIYLSVLEHLGMKRTLVFDFLSMVTMCIWRAKSSEVIQGQVCDFGGVFSGRKYEGAIVDIEGELVGECLPFC